MLPLNIAGPDIVSTNDDYDWEDAPRPATPSV